MNRIDKANFIDALESTRRDFHRRYYAMYSSVLKGIVTDPVLMLIPVDDHMVHRGDGVFEAFKCVNGSIYNMLAHLERLDRSAKPLGLNPPVPYREIPAIVVETARAGGHSDCLLRILLSRGPGGFSIDPGESPSTQLYVTASHLARPFMETHPEGARAIASAVPVKHSLFPTIKSCNYLHNVLMKKESNEAGVDFAVGFDENGHLTEGPSENMGIVTRGRRLLFPLPDRILAGTTMLRVAQLAQSLVLSDRLSAVEFADIPRADVMAAAEFLVVGTTRDVAAIVEFDGKKIADGSPGPICAELNALLQRDIRLNTELLTPVCRG